MKLGMPLLSTGKFMLSSKCVQKIIYLGGYNIFQHMYLFYNNKILLIKLSIISNIYHDSILKTLKILFDYFILKFVMY